MRYYRSITISFCIWLVANCIFSQGLTIPENAVLNLGSAELKLPDDFINRGTLNTQNGRIVFNGSAGDQTLIDSSSESYNIISIAKSSGNLVLASDINIKGSLSITDGDLDLNGFTITLDSLSQLNESENNTVIGNSGYIEFNEVINSPVDSNYHGMGLQITTSQNLGNTNVKRGNFSHTSNGNSSIFRFYNVTPTNNSSLNADLVFNYDETELNGLDESKLILFKSTDGGSSWQPKYGTVDTANNRISLSGVDTFSMWTLADSSASLTNHQSYATNTAQTIYFESGESSINLNDIVVSDGDGPSEQITAKLTLTDINSGSLSAGSGNGESYNPSTGIWTITNNLTTVNNALAAVSFLPAVNVRYNKTVSIYIADELADNTSAVTGTISLRVLNQPTTSVIDDIVVNEDAEDYLLDLSNYYDDAKDGADNLEYTFEYISNAALFFRYYIINEYLTLEFAHGVSGSTIITVRATDSDNLYIDNSFIVTVNSVNDGPYISSINNVYCDEDVSAEVIIQAYDPDGDKLTLSAASSDTNVQATINGTKLSLTPASNWFGTAHITIEASDGNISSYRTFPFIVNPVNDAPVFINQADAAFNEDESYMYDMHNCDSLVSDPDNDTYSYLLDYTLSCMEVHEESDHHCFTFTPPANWFGKDTVRIGVSDGLDTAYTDLILTVNPVNDLPVIENFPDSIKLIDDQTKIIDLWNLTDDVETADSLLNINFTALPDSVEVIYSDSTGILEIKSKEMFAGNSELTIIIEDPDGGITQTTATVSIHRTITGTNGQKLLPNEFVLYQNYPNPFNPTTNIKYGLPKESYVKLDVYNIIGEKIITLTDGIQSPGYYNIIWNASNMSSGIYFYFLTAEAADNQDAYSKVFKMILVK